MSAVAQGHLPAHLQGNFSVAGAGLEGATIGYAFLAGHGALPAQDLTVIPGIELPNFPGFGTPVGYMDISSNSLLIHFNTAETFPSDGFYGPILTDPYNEVPAITGFTLINNGGSTGLTPDDIHVPPDGNSVSVDLMGTSFTANSEISILFSFV